MLASINIAHHEVRIGQGSCYADIDDGLWLARVMVVHALSILEDQTESAANVTDAVLYCLLLCTPQSVSQALSNVLNVTDEGCLLFKW